MATKKRLDQLPAILSGDVGNNDLMYLVNENAQAETGYDSKKILVAEVAKKLLGGVELPTALPDFPTNKQNPIDALEYLQNEIINLYPVVTESGSLASFTTSLTLPLVSLKANITATQSGTGTPSPQNIRSISGFSSVTAYQVGKNLFDKTQTLEAGNITDDGSIGTATGYVHTDFIKVKAGADYVTSGDVALGNTRNAIACYNANKEFIIRLSPTGAGGWTFSIPSNTVYIRMNLGGSSRDLDTIQLEAGTTATAYEAYTENDTFTIALGDTYYGGVLDCKNGTATITHTAFSFDGSDDESWSNVAAQTNRANTISLGSTVGQPQSVAPMCNEFVAVSYTERDTSVANTCYVTPTRSLAVITTTEYDTAAKFKTFLASNNLTVVVQLATPVTISGLTPDNFTTLQGQNNIFADSGDVEVSFKQGIQEYIDNQIATTQALIL